jgi:hypothetical protein
MAVLYGLILAFGPGVVPMLLGVLLLAITTILSCGLSGPGPALLPLGVTVSVCLCWWGYKIGRRQSRELSAEIPLATLVEPAPSARAIRPEQVLGPWRFYVDAASSTVTVDLHADGRYTQVIIDNRGQQVDCPGGTWTLDGSYVELTSYRSAAQKATQPVRWFFGDWQNDLVLFAKDDPQADTPLLAQRLTAASIP